MPVVPSTSDKKQYVDKAEPRPLFLAGFQHNSKQWRRIGDFGGHLPLVHVADSTSLATTARIVVKGLPPGQYTISYGKRKETRNAADALILEWPLKDSGQVSISRRRNPKKMISIGLRRRHWDSAGLAWQFEGTTSGEYSFVPAGFTCVR